MDTFTNLEELYTRLLPALKVKCREMKREKNVKYIRKRYLAVFLSKHLA